MNLFGSVFFDVTDHGIDIDQYFASFFKVFDDDPVFPVEKNDQLETIDRIQPQAFTE
jgi:hypothetical protein